MPSSNVTRSRTGCAPLHACNKTYYYAITIKSTAKENYTESFDLFHELQLLNSARRSIDINHQVYELDSHNKLHIHAIVSTNKKFFARQKRGWHIHSTELETLDDVRRWYDYIYKVAYNEPSQEQILTLNYLYNHCCFI